MRPRRPTHWPGSRSPGWAEVFTPSYCKDGRRVGWAAERLVQEREVWSRVRPRLHVAFYHPTSAGANASNFWSGSSYVPNPTNAWNVNFNDGNTNANNKTNNNYVRLVRGG